MALLWGEITMQHSSGIGATEHEVRNPLGMARGIGNGDGATLRHAEESESL